MKKDIKEILSNITPETTIEEVAGYCDTVEDFDLIFKNLSAMECKELPITYELKETVLRMAALAKELNKEITACYVQKNLKVPYPQAVAMYEWLKNGAHI